ncbi:hypothetical protein HYH03_009861 [Edaphochlamys debaryana]|uniref:Uncharacterized protein n=1 Tax=Edaphochlamys debaryana TaxID=47281 RepID=A0A835XX95_9CHLO|nr:hypothetical protein HYH03_009861 [Edaphochlamys debaryana]|eukprot:KAG2491913.1 hypothetical protein HYH03_009861 [Edaphochlamys debaryana]
MDRIGLELDLSPTTRDFLAGAVAGAFAITLSQPLDTVRVRLQQAGATQNTLGALAAMFRQEGILSPWRGLTYPLLFASVQSAILFQAYGWTLRQLAAQPETQDAPALLAGASSSSASPSSSSLPSSLTSRPALSSSLPASASAFASASSPASIDSSHSLHSLHLHHHHHALPAGAQQDPAGVHGPASVSGAVAAWVAERLGLPGPPGARTLRPIVTSTRAAGEGGGDGAGGGEGAIACSASSGGTEAEGCSTSGGRGQGSSGGNSSGTAAAALAAAGQPVGSAGQKGRGAGGGGEGVGQGQGQGHGGDRGGGGGPAALPTPWQGFLAGSVAGMAQVFLWSPVELLKLRAQLQTAPRGSPAYLNPAQLAVQVLRADGVRGLYRGFNLTVVRDVPSYAMYFWLYHDIAAALSPGVHPEAAPPATQVVAGGLAGVIAWIPIYPLDVIKSRVQAVGVTASAGRGWTSFVQEMWAEAGARAFFRGVAPTLVRAFVMDGASFLGYTTALRVLGGGSSAAPATGGGKAAREASREGLAAGVPGVEAVERVARSGGTGRAGAAVAATTHA